MHLRTLTESEHRGALLSFKVGLLLNELLSRTCAWLHFTVIWSETLKCFLDHFVLENVFVLIYFSNLRHTVMEKPGSDVWAAFLACVSLYIHQIWLSRALTGTGNLSKRVLSCFFYLVWLLFGLKATVCFGSGATRASSLRLLISQSICMWNQNCLTGPSRDIICVNWAFKYGGRRPALKYWRKGGTCTICSNILITDSIQIFQCVRSHM